MNKYCIDEFLSEKLSAYRTTLKSSSYDDNNDVYMCSNVALDNVYNFDKYIYYNYDKSCLPASPDAIYVGKKKVYFIEFKNQYVSDINSSNIKAKFKNGTIILKEELLKDFSPRDIEYVFCVVHKDPKYQYFDPSHIEGNIIKFGLDEVNGELGGFYSKIITEPLSFYKEEFSEISCP